MELKPGKKRRVELKEGVPFFRGRGLIPPLPTMGNFFRFPINKNYYVKICLYHIFIWYKINQVNKKIHLYVFIEEHLPPFVLLHYYGTLEITAQRHYQYKLLREPRDLLYQVKVQKTQLLLALKILQPMSSNQDSL